jgi:hypothetical protein
VPGSVPFVDNDLLSSLGETLLVFEHLFDTGRVGVSRVGVSGSRGCAGMCRWRGWRWEAGRPGSPLSTCLFTPIAPPRLFLHTDRES